MQSLASSRPLVATVVLTLLIALLPTTALAGVAGPDGALSENSVFATVKHQQINEVTIRQFSGATLDGQPIAEVPGVDESSQDFAARVGAGACQYVLIDSQTERQFEEQTSEDPFLTNTDINPHGTLIDATALTIEERQALMVEGNVLVVGGPIVTGFEDFLVLWGTLVITWTYTVHFTDHYTDTTTETYSAECYTGYQACLYAGALSQVSVLGGKKLNCGRGTPIVIGAGDDFHACLYAGSLSQFGATEPKNCGRGGPIGIAAGETLYACHYKGSLSQVSTSTTPANCGRGAEVDLAGGVARR